MHLSARMNLRRVRALYIQPAPLFGGAERQAANNIPLLADFGVDVLPFVGPGTAIVDWLRERGVEHFVQSPHFPGGWPKQRGIRRATLPWRYLRCGIDARREMAQLVERYSMDIVIASLPFAWLTGSLVAREAGIPVIWRAGGSDVNAVQKSALWLVAQELRPDLLWCCADAVRRTVSPWIPAPVRVVPNGVDDRVFFPGAGDERRFRPRGARIVVGCAVRLAASKRPQDFIRLARKMKESHGDVAFLLAGEGSVRPTYEAFARDIGATNIDFLGYVADMPSFYAACDIVVLPSRAEGCPNFLLESMAMQRAVVASDTPGVLEIVRDGEHGVIYPIGDVDALASLVTNLVQDDAARVALAMRGYEKVRNLTASACAKTIASLVRNLVATNEATAAHAREAPIRAVHSGSVRPRLTPIE